MLIKVRSHTINCADLTPRDIVRASSKVMGLSQQPRGERKLAQMWVSSNLILPFYWSNTLVTTRHEHVSRRHFLRVHGLSLAFADFSVPTLRAWAITLSKRAVTSMAEVGGEAGILNGAAAQEVFSNGFLDGIYHCSVCCGHFMTPSVHQETPSSLSTLAGHEAIRWLWTHLTQDGCLAQSTCSITFEP